MCGGGGEGDAAVAGGCCDNRDKFDDNPISISTKREREERDYLLKREERKRTYGVKKIL